MQKIPTYLTEECELLAYVQCQERQSQAGAAVLDLAAYVLAGSAISAVHLISY